MKPLKRFYFEGEWLTATEIVAKCPAWSESYVRSMIHAGAQTIADISRAYEDGVARKRASSRKPSLKRIPDGFCARQEHGHSLPSFSFRMLAR